MIWSRRSSAVRDLTHLCRRIARCVWCCRLFEGYQRESISIQLTSCSQDKSCTTCSNKYTSFRTDGSNPGTKVDRVSFQSLQWCIGQAVLWSNSMNVLWWTKGRSWRIKPLVANRVGEIQSLTNPKRWRFVPTNENPADFTMRGMRVSDMAKENKWWSGS